MEYERIEWKEDELLQRMLERRGDERVHPTLTDLIYCLTKATYVEMQALKGVVRYDRRTALFFVLGLGLERALLGTEKNAPVGEKDGIPYHLDEMDMDELLELKTTRIKPGDAPSLTEGWERQIKGYVYAEGLTEVNFASLHLVQPDMRVFRLRFSERELEENWDWLLERKRVYDEFKARGEIPTPYEWRLGEWECKNCPFALNCEAVSLRNRVIRDASPLE